MGGVGWEAWLPVISLGHRGVTRAVRLSSLPPPACPQEIDTYIVQAKERSYETVLSFGKRGLNIAASAAVQAATKVPWAPALPHPHPNPQGLLSESSCLSGSREIAAVQAGGTGARGDRWGVGRSTELEVQTSLALTLTVSGCSWTLGPTFLLAPQRHRARRLPCFFRF